MLTVPFWDEPLRVIMASYSGTAVRIQAVGLHSGKYRNVTLIAAKFGNVATTKSGDAYRFDADPAFFRLAADALRTRLAHAFDTQFAVSVSQVDPLLHQLDAVYRHLKPLPCIRFLLADEPGAGNMIMAGLLMRKLMRRQDVRRVLVSKTQNLQLY